MTDREIERSRIEARVLRIYNRALVRRGTPSRLGVYPVWSGTLLLRDETEDRPFKTVKERR